MITKNPKVVCQNYLIIAFYIKYPKFSTISISLNKILNKKLEAKFLKVFKAKFFKKAVYFSI